MKLRPLTDRTVSSLKQDYSIFSETSGDDVLSAPQSPHQGA